MANFTPVLGDYTELKPFRFWCQKVLPLVYDDSLSYYELLCKVVDYLNKTMEDVDTLHTDVENLHTAYEQLQEYVNDYFDNLDVQEEINNKLDEMASSGVLVQILAPTIADEVGDWMEEHLSPTTPSIDDTLTVSGAGADAKTVGDDLGVQYNALSTYSKGDIILYNGQLYHCNTAITTPESFDVSKWSVINVGDFLETIRNGAQYNYGDPTTYGYTSCNDIITNGIFFVSSVEGRLQLTDMPFTSPCWLVTIGNDRNTFQWCLPWNITRGVAPKFRSRKLGTWQSWNTLPNYDSTIKTIGWGDNLSSCDSAEDNSIYFISSSGSVNTPADFPIIGGGILITFSVSNAKYQIALTFSKNTVTTRWYLGTWRNWLKQYNEENFVYNYGGAEVLNSCDSVDRNSVYFISSTGGVPSPADSPITSGWLITYHQNSNIILQFAFDYLGKNNLFRIKRIGTGWSSWLPVVDYRAMPYNYGDPTSDMTSCNEVTYNSIYFVSTIGGVPNLSEWGQTGPGWLWTISAGNQTFQFAFPWNDNVSIKYRIRRLGTWYNWGAISSGEISTITQEVSRDTYNNTYNITTSPTITTDTNGWLASVDTDTPDETSKTDMGSAIMSMLESTGYCHLSEGIFYISTPIDIPSGATLEGCGNGTILRLMQSQTTGYIARLKEYGTIKNIRFSGGYSTLDVTASENIGGRKGVIYIGNRDGEDTGVTPTTTKESIIQNCWFENLDSGIYCYNSGGGTQEGLMVDNCYIQYCMAGINIDYWSEYHNFTNVVTYRCHYACINNGGNNKFVNCIFHGIEGFIIDNSGNDKPNNTHGSCVCCTFNHIKNFGSNTSNPIGIKILGGASGFMFVGCQLWYSNVLIQNSKGVSFGDCLFGNDAINITVEGTTGAYFNNCMFHTTPTLNVNNGTHFANCYNYQTNAEITN